MSFYVIFTSVKAGYFPKVFNTKRNIFPGHKVPGDRQSFLV